MPTITECQGSVPKKGPDKFRAIADGREGNKSLDDWGVRYFTWQDFFSCLSPSFWRDALTPRAIVLGHDMQDGYHISVMGGAGVGLGSRGAQVGLPEPD